MLFYSCHVKKLDSRIKMENKIMHLGKRNRYFQCFHKCDADFHRFQVKEAAGSTIFFGAVVVRCFFQETKGLAARGRFCVVVVVEDCGELIFLLSSDEGFDHRHNWNRGVDRLSLSGATPSLF